MNEEDPRWARSRALLLEAISGYLDKGVTPSITDITVRAGVSRPTFYQHFGDLPTAYASAAVERIEREFSRIPAPPVAEDISEDLLLATLTQLFTHQLAHRDFYTTAIRSGGDALSESLVDFLRTRLTTASPFAARLDADDASTYDQVTALAAGVVWLIQHWLVEPEPRPAEFMARRVLEVILAFLNTAARVA